LRVVKDPTLSRNRPIDCGEISSLTHQTRSTPKNIFIAVWLSFLLQAGQNSAWLKGIDKFIKIIQVIGSRTRDFPATLPLQGRLALAPLDAES
jgi:hypothetical protein